MKNLEVDIEGLEYCPVGPDGSDVCIGHIALNATEEKQKKGFSSLSVSWEQVSEFMVASVGAVG